MFAVLVEKVFKLNIDQSDIRVHNTSMSWPYVFFCVFFNKGDIDYFFKYVCFMFVYYMYILFRVCVKTHFVDFEEFAV